MRRRHIRHFSPHNKLTSFGRCGRGFGGPSLCCHLLLNEQDGKVDFNDVTVCKMTIHPARRIFELAASCGGKVLRKVGSVAAGEYLLATKDFPTKGTFPGIVCKQSRHA